jgi:hypothetical protein
MPVPFSVPIPLNAQYAELIHADKIRYLAKRWLVNRYPKPWHLDRPAVLPAVSVSSESLAAYKALVEANIDEVSNQLDTPWRKWVGPGRYRDICGCIFTPEGEVVANGIECKVHTIFTTKYVRIR